MVVVFQQDDGFFSGFQSQRVMLRLAVLAVGNRGMAHGFRRIEHAELESQTQQAGQRAIHIFLADQSAADGFRQGLEGFTAAQIVARLDGQRAGFLCGLGEFVGGMDVEHGIHIADDSPLETPFLAQHAVQQHRACRARHTIHGVVGRHQRHRAALADRGFKSREIRLALVTCGNLRIEHMAR